MTSALDRTAASPTVLAIDVGTSTLKAVVYSRAGQVLHVASRRYGYTMPQPGWAEADPAAWWAALEAAMVDLRQALPALAQVQLKHHLVVRRWLG